jgi:hypothetical protein
MAPKEPVTDLVQADAAELEIRALGYTLRHEDLSQDLRVTFTDWGGPLPVSDEVDAYNCSLIDERIVRSVRGAARGGSSIARGAAIHRHFDAALRLLDEGWRPVCTKRARKLRRRGDHAIWIVEFGSHAWQPPHLKAN